jgi:hypothetical protein
MRMWYRECMNIENELEHNDKNGKNMCASEY